MCTRMYHRDRDMHEYGHTLQSRNYGIFYLPYIGPRSLISAAFSSDHREKWYEREASAYARRKRRRKRNNFFRLFLCAIYCKIKTK